MLVSRYTTLLLCLLFALSGVHAVDSKHFQKLKMRTAPTTPTQTQSQSAAQFKEQAKAEVSLKQDLSRSQQQLEMESRMLSMQQEEAQLLLKLKSLHEQREHAERSLVRQRLVVSQRQTARLVDDLARFSKIKMLLDLRKLNDVVGHAMSRHSTSPAAKPTSVPLDSKFKQEPTAAEPSSGVESDAKKQLHKKLVSKAVQVVDAQLDSILNSDELAYIKAHNEMGDTDTEETSEGEIVEEDRGARPGESPDEHYKRLSKEADALMAKAYPFIRCEGGASGGTGHHASSTGGTAESSTAEISTAESSTGQSSTGESSTGETGTTGTAGSSTGESITGSDLEAGATTATGAATATATGTETGAPAAATEGSSTAEAAPAPAPAAEAPAPAPAE